MIRMLTIALFTMAGQAHAKLSEPEGTFKTFSGKTVTVAGSRYCFETAPGAQSSDPTMTYANIVIGGQKGEPVFIKKDLLIEMNCEKKVGELKPAAPLRWSDESSEEATAGS